MQIIKYTKGNILDYKNYSCILIHSCNCNGSWGGRIAYQLAVRYPQAKQEYIDICNKYGLGLLGKCALIRSSEDDDLIIACLFTTSLGGYNHDSKASILKYTSEALKDLQRMIHNPNESTILKLKKELLCYKLEMPQINSGILGIPWEEIEAVLNSFKNKELKFTVCVL